jgi:hypothetical protein
MECGMRERKNRQKDMGENKEKLNFLVRERVCSQEGEINGAANNNDNGSSSSSVHN